MNKLMACTAAALAAQALGCGGGSGNDGPVTILVDSKPPPQRPAKPPTAQPIVRAR